MLGAWHGLRGWHNGEKLLPRSKLPVVLFWGLQVQLIITCSRDCWPNDPKYGTGGIFLWVNADGMAAAPGRPAGARADGSEWAPHCLSAAHNTGWKARGGDPAMLFNASSGSETYNSLVQLGPRSAAVFYSIQSVFEPWAIIGTFMMRVAVG